MNQVHIQQPAGIDRRGFMRHVYDWVNRYNDLGYEGLIHHSKNKVWSREQRFELVAKVIAGFSISEVAVSYHINPGQLHQWLKKYQEKGIDGLECRQGRKPKKVIKLSASEKEEHKLLRERNEYLEIENEYLKKLDALVAQKEAKQLKAKKRQ